MDSVGSGGHRDFGRVGQAAGTSISFSLSLEEVVSDGVPGPGAGNIENAGDSDEYTVAIVAGTEVFVDELGGGCAIAWSAVDPFGTQIFSDSGMCGGDPGSFVLTEDR